MASTKDLILSQFKQFDASGSGRIEKLVLCSLFKRLDGSLWTDANIETLLQAMGAPGANISFEDFIEWVFSDQAVFTPRPPSMPRSGAATSSVRRRAPQSAALEAYMQELIFNIKGSWDLVKPSVTELRSGSSPQEVAAMMKALKDRTLNCWLQAQRRNVSPIWREFRSGQTLSLRGCTRLISAYIRALKPKSDAMVRASLEIGMELSLAMEPQLGPKADHQRRSLAKRQVEMVAKAVAPCVRETLDRVEKDPGQTAHKLLESLDVNRDGKVTQDDFECGFVDSMHQIFGSEQLMA